MWRAKSCETARQRHDPFSARAALHDAHETAVRQQVILLCLAVPLGFFLTPGPAWYVAMVGALIVSLAVELLNTAIERLQITSLPSNISKSA